MKKMMDVGRMLTFRKQLLLVCLTLMFALSTRAQGLVSGTVKDAEGSALPSVTVKLKGTAVATTTDVNGAFQISAPGEGTLVFTMLGFTAQEQRIANRNKIAILLAAESEVVEEVVVVGYNVVKKSDLTGSVTTVSSEEITAMPVNNSLQALQGRAAGVDVTSNERPGEVGSVRVRGERSILASNSPLYVVDGVPLNSGGIEFLNPKDIETMDILKDASATAIYGSRGANGVIIITTKRGKTGHMTLDYSGTSTIENLHDLTEMMNSAQYIDFRRDAFRRIDQYPDQPDQASDQTIFGQDPIAWANVLKGWQNGTWDGSLVPTTDWTGYVTKTGVTHDHILSSSGGTEKVQAYGSFGYLKQDGTQLGQDYQRYSGKLSIDIKPKDWFRMGAVLNSTYGDQNYGYATTNATGPGNLYFAARAMLPYAVPFDPNGERINLPGGDVNIQNPILETNFNVNERLVFRNFGSIYAEVEPIKGLRYKVNFGPDYYSNRNGRWMDEQSVNRGAGEPGSTNYAQLNQDMRFSWTLDNLLYYNKTFASAHNVGATFLQTATVNRTESSSMTAVNLPWNYQKWYQLNSVDALQGFSSNLIEQQLTSYMVRLNYDFNGKYLFTGSMRWDGSSVLAKGYQWDTFPSLAVAWRLDKEKFLENSTWINQLKARIGYGVTGNSAVDPYMTLGMLQILYYTWGDLVEPGYVPSDPSTRDPLPMPNKELGWEKTSQINYGVDFALFKNRVSGSLDFYTSTTKDLLLPRNIPTILGYTTTWDNVGQTSNKGIDITVNTVNVETTDFSWNSTVSFTYSENRLEELAQGKFDDPSNARFIGKRIGAYFDFVKVGIWQDTPEDLAEMARFAENGSVFRPGDIRVKDANGDYFIDANDREIVGYSTPTWNFGFANTFAYRNVDLTFFIYGRGGFMVRGGAEALQGRFAQREVNYWTPSNPTNEYPAPNYNNAGGDPYMRSMDYQDGTFIKLRNVSLGYTLPTNLTERLKLSRLRIYAQAMNPGLLYSKVDWIDPDLGGSTFNRGVVFGLNVGF